MLAPLPDGVIEESRFLSIFTDICLESSLGRSEFDTAAKSLGLYRETDLRNLKYWYEREESPDSFDSVWMTNASHASEAMLEVALRYRSSFRWELGSPSYIVDYEEGDPTMILSCSVAAIMPSLTEENRSDFEAKAANTLLTKARQKSFRGYTEDYSVTPEDVDVSIRLSKTQTYVDMREGSSCPAAVGCWAYTPYEITLLAVTDRYSK